MDDRERMMTIPAPAPADEGEPWRTEDAGDAAGRGREPARAIHGVVVGTVAACGSAGVWVDFPENPAGVPVRARCATPLGAEDAGCEVALLFEGGDPARPFVVGRMEAGSAPAADANPVRAEVDGGRLVLTAEREIVLRCGEASITLTRAGKVLVRGAYLLSRSSGVNRIRGGSVQIN